MFISIPPPPPMIRGIWTSYGYHILDLYNYYKVTQVRLVRTHPNLYHFYLVTWGVAHARKIISPWKTSCERTIWINVKVSVRIRLYTLCPIFNIIQKYITGDHMLTSSHIFFRGNIFNVCIRCIWINSMYITFRSIIKSSLLSFSLAYQTLFTS